MKIDESVCVSVGILWSTARRIRTDNTARGTARNYYDRYYAAIIGTDTAYYAVAYSIFTTIIIVCEISTTA